MAFDRVPTAAAIIAMMMIMAQTPANAAETTGAWRLVRTPSPYGGADAVSITHTAEFARSDPDFAGLMFRCTDSGPEAVVVLIVPLSPRSQPQVTLMADGGRELHVDATVGMPGAIVVLPRAAAVAFLGAWQSSAQVAIEVAAEGRTIHGVVALAGLDQAIKMLNANCAGSP
jgi:hypothetical protein